MCLCVVVPIQTILTAQMAQTDPEMDPEMDPERARRVIWTTVAMMVGLIR